jgi:hypothetical protein
MAAEELDDSDRSLFEQLDRDVPGEKQNTAKKFK